LGRLQPFGAKADRVQRMFQQLAPRKLPRASCKLSSGRPIAAKPGRSRYGHWRAEDS
jgi:hypothetical protein